MNKIISYCGLICSDCPIYLAGRENDKSKKDNMINEIIRQCREHYGIEYKYLDINDCDGCKSESGRLFFGCFNCGIRKCASGKGYVNCAYCSEYPCENLIKFFETDSAAKVRLDEIRNNLKNS